MSFLAAAISAYQKKEFVKALALFEQAGAHYGFELVQTNIQLCRRALSAEKEGDASGAELDETDGVAGESGQLTVAKVFDQIYLVNLKGLLRRRFSSAAQLKRYRIPFVIFDAVNGHVGEVNNRYQDYASAPLGSLKRYSDFNEREVSRGKKFIESAGAYGYIETYLAILRDAKRKNFRRILVLEDDVILHPNFHDSFSSFIARVPTSWKVIQLGASQYGWGSVEESAALTNGYYAPRCLDTCGSFAIGIDCSVYDEIIEAQSAFEAPFDHLPMGEVYERNLGHCYVAYPNIVVPDVTESSIRHSRDQHIHSRRMRWRLEQFVHPLPKPTLAVQLTSRANLRYLDRFEVGEGAPYALNMYVAGEDGLRPVHDAQFFDLPSNQRIDASPAVNLPPADCYARIDPDRIMTEEDILACLENQLVDGNSPTALSRLQCLPATVVSGRVSVIVPTFSRSRNLSAALESIATQNYPDIQLLVVSDNPPDTAEAREARDITEAVGVAYPALNVKFIQHRHNRNGAAARNTGILHSNGEFICFLDDDDIYLPGRLTTAVAALRDCPESIGAVYCGFVGWNSPVDDPSRYKGGDLTRELLLLNYKSHYLHTNTATYRRSAILRINGFDETYRRHQDLELNLRFFEYYDIGTVRHSGVRLSPARSSVDNRLFNSNFIDLKQKFLDRFRLTIGKFPHDDAAEVYRRHWNEVARYVRDRAQVDRYLTQVLANGPLQVALLLNRADA